MVSLTGKHVDLYRQYRQTQLEMNLNKLSLLNSEIQDLNKSEQTVEKLWRAALSLSVATVRVLWYQHIEQFRMFEISLIIINS